jgi:hypothetical protein
MDLAAAASTAEAAPPSRERNCRRTRLFPKERPQGNHSLRDACDKEEMYASHNSHCGVCCCVNAGDRHGADQHQSERRWRRARRLKYKQEHGLRFRQPVGEGAEHRRQRGFDGHPRQRGHGRQRHQQQRREQQLAHGHDRLRTQRHVGLQHAVAELDEPQRPEPVRHVALVVPRRNGRAPPRAGLSCLTPL